MSQCHPEAIAEGSRLRKQQEMRDSSLALLNDIHASLAIATQSLEGE